MEPVQGTAVIAEKLSVSTIMEAVTVMVVPAAVPLAEVGFVGMAVEVAVVAEDMDVVVTITNT